MLYPDESLRNSGESASAANILDSAVALDANAVEPTKQNVICMGMVYASEAHANKVASFKEEGQARRDRLKCLAIEKLLGANVYTIDNKHGEYPEYDSQLEPGRHCNGNFNKKSCIERVMKLISGDVSLILFDFYFMIDGTWVEETWKLTSLFENAIPGCRFFYGLS